MVKEPPFREPPHRGVPRRSLRVPFGGRPRAIHSRTHQIGSQQTGVKMKVRASVKKICSKCKIVQRKSIVRVICDDPRHKQRQG